MRPVPSSLDTDRLRLRRPHREDAASVFAYAGDPEATRLMGWPIHRSIDDTQAFLDIALHEWSERGVGPYLIERDGIVLGSTGLHLREPLLAVTGYILLRAAWGRGYATEACRAMLQLGEQLGLERIEAHCHHAHPASAHVLEKCGMRFEGVLERHLVFPNLSCEPQDVRSYAWLAEGLPRGGSG